MSHMYECMYNSARTDTVFYTKYTELKNMIIVWRPESIERVRESESERDGAGIGSAVAARWLVCGSSDGNLTLNMHMHRTACAT